MKDVESGVAGRKPQCFFKEEMRFTIDADKPIRTCDDSRVIKSSSVPFRKSSHYIHSEFF